MRIAVTGREGQVARSLAERAATGGIEVVTIGRPELDLAGPAEAINSAIVAAKPDVIVSAAAYTQVDKAESEPKQAFAINEGGARAVAKAAAGLGVPLIHVSTDYVFDGQKTSAYVEADATDPQSVYGASKLAGEQAVLAAHPNSAVLRTAWVYSPFASNFVKTMLRLAAERDEIAVVADQLGNPTSARDIADGIVRVARNLRGGGDPAQRGVFHMAGAGVASWAEFAEEIFRLSADAGGPWARVRHIPSSDYSTAAKRPANSRLDSSKLARLHNVSLPDWRTSLKDVVPRLLRGA